MKFNNVCLEAFGYELPTNVWTSDDIEELIGPVYEKLKFKKGQLEALTGIHERRYWDIDFPVSRGAIVAGKKAFEKTDLNPSDIEMLIYSAVCRENLEPATACAVADGLGIGPDAMVFDITNACLGVLNGIVQIATAIEAGQIKAGMVLSCETSKRIMDITIESLNKNPDMENFRQTIATLTGGSGAIAVIVCHKDLSAEKRRILLGGAAKNSVRHHDLCVWGYKNLSLDGYRMQMRTDSISVLQNGVKLGIDTYQALKKNIGLTDSQPDKVICHQVGAAHQRTILESIGISPEKDFQTYPFLGNIGTVSLPITAAIAEERDFLNPGDLVYFLGIGSGLNCMMLGFRW